MPMSSPFQNRDIASNGVTYAVPVHPGIGSAILAGAKDVMGVMGQQGQAQERKAQTGLYNQEAASKKAVTDRVAAKDSAIVAATKQLHDEITQGGDPKVAYQHFQENTAAYYGDDHGAEGMNSLQRMGNATAIADPNASQYDKNLAYSMAAADNHPIKDNEATTDAEHQGQLKQVDDTKRFEYKTKADAERYGADQSAGATVKSAGIHAAADVTVGKNRDATTRDVEKGHDQTSIRNETYKTVYPTVFGAAMNGPKGSGQTQQVVKDKDGKVVKSTTTTKGPLPQSGPAAANPAAPRAPNLPRITDSAQAQAAIAEGMAAIQKGADPAKVKARLLATGVQPPAGM